MADLGQVFTKKVVADYMVSLFNLSKEALIMDPCFGGGAFLCSLKKKGYKQVTACEIDSCLCKYAEKKYRSYSLLNADFLGLDNTVKYDGIIMNPPYIRHEKIDELSSCGITKKKLRENAIFSGLPGTANLYMYFIMKAIDLLKDNGQLIVIFPSSWMNAKNGVKFRHAMLSETTLEREVHIYGDVFEKTALVDVVILKLIKCKKDKSIIPEYLESKAGRITPISSIETKNLPLFETRFADNATICRGLTTGYNEMYINPPISENDICIKQIISSPKSIQGFSTFNCKLDRLLSPTEGQLSDDAVHYLELWKKIIVETQHPKTLYHKIIAQSNWYQLREIPGKGILFSYFVRNDMKFIMNEEGFMPRDNFYIIRPKVNLWIMFAFLNNYYTFYQLEQYGKKYGAGLLKLQRYDMEQLVFPNIQKISKQDVESLIHFAHQLADTGDISVIDSITRVMSKYSTVNYDDILKKYFTIKNNRLEVK